MKSIAIVFLGPEYVGFPLVVQFIKNLNLGLNQSVIKMSTYLATLISQKMSDSRTSVYGRFISYAASTQVAR